MKKLLSFVLALAVCAALFIPVSAAGEESCEGLPLYAAATNDTIAVSSSTDQPDAHLVRPAVYKIMATSRSLK